MDIHFRASDIPVQTQWWLTTLLHTLSFVTTPTPGRGGGFLYYIPSTRPSHHRRLSALSFHVWICHLELRRIRILHVSTQPSSSVSTCLLLKAAFPSPEKCSNLALAALCPSLTQYSTVSKGNEITTASPPFSGHLSQMCGKRWCTKALSIICLLIPQGMRFSQDPSSLSIHNLFWDWQLSSASQISQ